MTPDQWLLAKAKADPEGMSELAERCRLRLARPPLSKADHLEALRRSGLTQFADFLASRVGRVGDASARTPFEVAYCDLKDPRPRSRHRRAPASPAT
jgi:hypothetical protein